MSVDEQATVGLGTFYFLLFFVVVVLVLYSRSKGPTKKNQPAAPPDAHPIAPSPSPEPLPGPGASSEVLGCVGALLLNALVAGLVVGGVLFGLFLLVQFIKWAWTF